MTNRTARSTGAPPTQSGALSIALSVAVALSVLAGCGDGTTDSRAAVPPDTAVPDTAAPDTAASATDGPASSDEFPDILEAVPTFDETSGTWSFAVTVSSPYDTPERYADGWRVVGPDGTVYGVHTLTHDHANEQPFTRRQSGVEIPEDVTEVTIEGRDQANGFGGTTVTVALDTT